MNITQLFMDIGEAPQEEAEELARALKSTIVKLQTISSPIQGVMGQLYEDIIDKQVKVYKRHCGLPASAPMPSDAMLEILTGVRRMVRQVSDMVSENT